MKFVDEEDKDPWKKKKPREIERIERKSYEL
jgi:hypothetical protein